MAYGEKLVLTCANEECGKVWTAVKSQARQCCSKECSDKVRLARGKATKNKEEVKAKIRETRIAKWGAWNSSEIMQASVERRKQANGGSYFTEEERAKMSEIHKTNRTTESRKESSKLVNTAAMVEASRKTREERYGKWSSHDLVKKGNATKVERYGSAHPIEFVEARKATMVERYGVEHALQIPGKAKEAQAGVDKVARQEKQTATNIERYGVENPMMVPEIAAMATQKRAALQRPVYAEVKTKEWWDREYKEAGESLEGLAYKFNLSTSHLGLVAKSLGYPITNPISSSVIERRFADAVEALGAKVVRNTKKVIAPQEIDIFLPDYKLAIEVNGIYWHSEEIGLKGPFYHYDKMMRCEAQRIRLIQFWDFELVENFDLCLSMVKTAIGQNEKVYARECEISEISVDAARQFMSKNHIAGFRGGKHVGLSHGGSLVSVMTSGISHYARGTTEVKRFASLQGITVVGGFSKLLSKVPRPLISYSDNRYSRGGVYSKTGFVLTREGKGTPWYTKDCSSLHHRTAIIDKNRGELTQREAARQAGWLTVWDAGQRTWRLE